MSWKNRKTFIGHWTGMIDEYLMPEFDEMEYNFAHVPEETGSEAYQRINSVSDVTGYPIGTGKENNNEMCNQRLSKR